MNKTYSQLDDKEIYIKKAEQKTKCQKLYTYLFDTFNYAKNSRSPLVAEWIEDYKQYNQIDEFTFKEDYKRSRTFEPYTALKVDQQVARLFELFMPNGDKNFGLFTSNNPNLKKSKLQNIITNLESQYGPNLPKSIISKAVKEIADENARKLENKMSDYLIDSGFEEKIHLTTRSASTYGTGVFIGPLLRERVKSVADTDEFGNNIAKEVTYLEPFVESLDIFNWFPDLDSKNRDEQDYNFFYKTLNKRDLLKLAEIKTYDEFAIRDYVKNNPSGNFQFESWESTLMNYNNESTNIKPKKYRLIEFWGNVDANDVKDYFKGTKDEVKKDEDIISINAVMLGDTIIKCVRNPFNSKKIPVQFFPLYKRSGQLTGTGLCRLLREKQKQLNVCVRSKFDNLAESVIPMREINTDLFLPQNIPNKLNPGRVLFRTGLGDSANYPAIRQVQTQPLIQILSAEEQQIKHDMDIISSLSGLMTGDMTDVGKTLGRTSSGVNALMGGANTNLKDITKQFDAFLKYFYEMLIEIIFLISDKDSEELFGDYQVVPKVSSAIVDKQLNLNNLLATVNQLQPEQRNFYNWKEVTRQQVLYSNLDPDVLLLSADDIAKQEEQSRMQQEQMTNMQQQIEGQKQQIENQRLQIEGIKASGKNAVDMAKAQEILNKIELSKGKGDLDSMLALHKIDMDRSKENQTNDQMKYNILKDEIDRQDNFSKE